MPRGEGTSGHPLRWCKGAEHELRGLMGTIGFPHAAHRQCRISSPEDSRLPESESRRQDVETRSDQDGGVVEGAAGAEALPVTT